MALITYIERDGITHQVEVQNGQSVMQDAVDNMIDRAGAKDSGRR